MISSTTKLFLGLYLTFSSVAYLTIGTILTNGTFPLIGISGSFLASSGILLIMLWELDNREKRFVKNKVKKQKKSPKLAKKVI